MIRHILHSYAVAINAACTEFGGRVYIENEGGQYPKSGGGVTTLKQMTRPFCVVRDGGSVKSPDEVGGSQRKYKDDCTIIAMVHCKSENIGTARNREQYQVLDLPDKVSRACLAEINVVDMDSGATLTTAAPFGNISTGRIEDGGTREIVQFARAITFQIEVRRETGATTVNN